jgi:hypothetical protein
MTEEAGNGRPRRILVALDASEESQKQLEATARLAADLEAELVGLFVEESELIEAAALPMTRLIHRQGQGQAALDPALMRRAFRITSSRARSALAATAERWQVRWSFQVAHGALSDQVLSQARSHDLLALGRPRRARQGARPAEALRRMTAEAVCSILLLQRGETRARPVVVLYEGAERSLAVGYTLARAEARAFRIVALGDSEAVVAERAAAAAAWLERLGRRGTVHGLVSTEPAEVRAALRGQSPGAVVLDCRGTVAPRLELEELADQLGCSVLALRA